MGNTLISTLRCKGVRFVKIKLIFLLVCKLRKHEISLNKLERLDSIKNYLHSIIMFYKVSIPNYLGSLNVVKHNISSNFKF